MRRTQLLAATVLSACIGTVGGSAAAWAVYLRLGPSERVVAQPVAPGGQADPSAAGGAAADRSASVVSIATRAITPERLLSGDTGMSNGFVAGADGLIVTSAAAVSGATRLRVALGDGEAHDAVVAGTDPVHGLVALRAVGAHDLTPLPFARRAARPGDAVLLLSRPPLRPLGIIPGTVVSTGETLATGVDADPTANGAMRLSLAAPGGGEGAPLIDERGDVIGVATAPPAPAGGPSELAGLSGQAAAALVDRLEGRAVPSRATLGLDSALLDPATAGAAGLRSGALIRSVTPDGPAAAAGLARGDIVTDVNGLPVDSDHPLDPVTAHLDPGQRITLSVLGPAGDSRNLGLVVGSE